MIQATIRIDSHTLQEVWGRNGAIFFIEIVHYTVHKSRTVIMTDC